MKADRYKYGGCLDLAMSLLLVNSVGCNDLLDNLVAELEILLDRGAVLNLDPDDGSGDKERRSASCPLQTGVVSIKDPSSFHIYFLYFFSVHFIEYQVNLQ